MNGKVLLNYYLSVEIKQKNFLIQQIGVSKKCKQSLESTSESNELEFAVDLVKSLNNPSLCSEILSSIRLVGK